MDRATTEPSRNLNQASPRQRKKWQFFLFLIVVCYPTLIWLSDYLKDQTNIVAVIWLSNPLILALLLCCDKKDWPAILGITASATFASALIIQDFTVPVSLLIVIADCMEPFLGAFLIKRATGDTPFDFSSLRNAFYFVLYGLIIAVIPSALIGAFIVHYAFQGEILRVWLVWGLSDALGLLVLTPVFVRMWRFYQKADEIKFISQKATVEGALLFISALITSHFIFSQDSQTLLTYPYLLFPFFIWAALRFDSFYVSCFMLVIIWRILDSFINQSGPFFLGTDTYSFLVQSFQTYSIVSLLLALILNSIAMDNRRYNIETARTRERLKKSNIELSRANAELKQFSYRTSHDLRAPLISTIALLEVAGQAVKDNDAPLAQQSLGLASNSLNQLESLVRYILVMNKIKTEHEESEWVDLAQIVDESLSKLSHHEGFEKIEVITDYEHTSRIKTQKTKLQLIADNLISNAIKYYDPAKQRPYIRIYTQETGGHLLFGVEDNGLGIPKDKQDKLFTMFNRIHPGKAAGSGLGLYMVKKAAETIDADIHFKRHLEGSIFELDLPLSSEDTPIDSAPVRHQDVYHF